MSPSTLFFPLAFIALSACVLWILAKTKGAVVVKSILVVVTISFGVAMWSALGGLEGWPAPNPPEKSFELHSAIVVEPDKNVGEEGRIYLWLTPRRNPDRSMSWFARFRTIPHDEPRAYRIRYSKPLHKKLAAAKKLMKRGQRIMMSLKKVPNQPKSGRKGQKASIYKNYQAEFWYPLPPASWRKPSAQ